MELEKNVQKFTENINIMQIKITRLKCSGKNHIIFNTFNWLLIKTNHTSSLDNYLH